MISLTRNGVSKNSVLDQIIDDLRVAGKMGVSGTDTKGNTYVIFEEEVGFVGDFSPSYGVWL